MTVEEILKLVEINNISVENFAHGDFELEALGKWEEIEQHGGEGEGDSWYSVKYFEDHKVYIKTWGSYSSYNGTEFEDGYGEEVKPIQRTVTFYE